MTKALGRGLQSLIPQKSSKIARKAIKVSGWLDSKLDSKKESVFNVEVDKIRPNPLQPRREMAEENLKELADSIREHGIIQPLVVTKVEKTNERGRQVEYELIAGERRWRAAKMVGLPHVPVIIRDSARQQKLELALVENIQRENLDPISQALAYKQLSKEFGLTHGQIGQKLGKDRTTISNVMRMLTLPKEAQKAMLAGRINEGHGRAILLAKDEARLAVFKAITKENLSVRQTEDRARKFLPVVARPGTSGPKNEFFRQMESDLREKIGRRVSIVQRREIGHLHIEFYDRKELDRLVDHLMKI